MKLNGEFVRLYGLLESDYGQCRTEIESMPKTESERDNRLNQLILEFEPIRRNHMQELGEITATFSLGERERHQAWVQGTEHFRNIQEAPFCRRIINKPEGYPGDYRLMEMIYAKRFEGKTDWGKFIHKQALESKACQAVRNRKEFLREQILSLNGGGARKTSYQLLPGPPERLRKC